MSSKQLGLAGIYGGLLVAIRDDTALCTFDDNHSIQS